MSAVDHTSIRNNFFDLYDEISQYCKEHEGDITDFEVHDVIDVLLGREISSPDAERILRNELGIPYAPERRA
uniref:Uncharacterized protein n=1 Tax=Candidatus Kentrum sp. LFY TaxID=2126342 RepID=A0A450WGT3_9GAMM|nr:MAG: hypothetical protein BECKLFY1418C_GA0070996_10229 [Candidatus Kentron sp. LFY]